ncbi:acyl-CoA dehydrogenase [Saccharophagus degradans]|uniref:Acyl-CoA dehydrogenase n=1 Tax=Saccharophagus degradans TaxID=86304 RepID=A0AAW7XAT5_9GAMM|nr:acyl-CoA dehydrogenase [Saccharophagus degradans]MDO6423701.1 acyl-CoA dehydrogenase [Saccharophagus degradans]MDO6607628.1 acyl-CoA dehydrogenase [Saccharophagus degradans]
MSNTADVAAPSQQVHAQQKEASNTDLLSEFLNLFDQNKANTYDIDFFKTVFKLCRPETTSKFSYYAELEEHIAYIESFAASELISNQLNFVAPLLELTATMGNSHSSHNSHIPHSNAENPKLAQQLLSNIRQGEMLFSRVLTIPEQAENSTQAPFGVSASENKNGWLLNGALNVVLFNKAVSHHLVLATLPNNNTLVTYLPTQTTGITTAEHAQLGAPKANNTQFEIANLRLQNVLINNGVIGEINTQAILDLVARSRIMSAIRHNQYTRMCLDKLILFLKSRTSNGDPLINQQVIQHRLAKLEARLSSSCALSRYSLKQIAVGKDTQALASASKLLASELLVYASKQALHLGGITHFQKNKPIANSYTEANWANFFLEPKELLLRNILDTSVSERHQKA